MILAPTRYQEHGKPALLAALDVGAQMITLFNGASIEGDHMKGRVRVRKPDVPTPLIGIAPTVGQDGTPDGRGILVASLAGPTQIFKWTMK